MSFLESLFSGARVFLRQVVKAVAEVVHVVLEEIDRSPIGKAATQLLVGVTNKYFGAARELAAEEQEMAERFRRDGRRSSRDEDRLQEIAAERDRLRKKLDAAKAQEATEELVEAREELVARPITADETSAAVGIIASRVCLECGGTMRIRQGGFDEKKKRHSFYWSCTANPFRCPKPKLDPEKEQASVLRRPDPNLDLKVEERRAIWQRQDVVVDTARRLRQHLGDEDKAIICPQHLLPMKILENRNASGLPLNTYEYVCLGVEPDGRACQHRVPIETFPQASELLRRHEGHGIIKG